MMNKHALHLVVYSLLLAALFFFCAELFLRGKGYSPYSPLPPDVVVVPGGKFFQKHPRLGYAHLSGKYKLTLNHGGSFTVTHHENTLRATHRDFLNGEKSDEPEIWILGCSFTHGWSLNDEDTFPWVLQEKMPTCEVVNFGVRGYGTLQMLIQFKDALEKRKKPDVVVVTYASFHDERNTFLRSRQKGVAPYSKLGPLVQPYARLYRDKKLFYGMAKVEYTEFPLMRWSSFMVWVETRYNAIEDYFYHSHDVSKTLMREFSSLCNQNGIKLVIAGITNDPKTLEMLRYCKGEGIMAFDMSVDLSVPRNTNLPWDVHPSAFANKQYAEKLYAFLNGHVPGQEKIRAALGR